MSMRSCVDTGNPATHRLSPTSANTFGRRTVRIGRLLAVAVAVVVALGVVVGVAAPRRTATRPPGDPSRPVSQRAPAPASATAVAAIAAGSSLRPSRPPGGSRTVCSSSREVRVGASSGAAAPTATRRSVAPTAAPVAAAAAARPRSPADG